MVGFSRFAPVRANRLLDSHTVCEPVTKILENVTLVFDFIFHSCTYIKKDDHELTKIASPRYADAPIYPGSSNI